MAGAYAASMRVVVVAIVLVIVGACATAGSAEQRSAPVSVLPAVDPVGGLPVVVVADLPPEAGATLELIAAGGPFPHRQDGAVFQNREGILPARDPGHYHEYTVETPGSDDRGARRIVTGADGERYWTDDHYDSFSWIAP